VREVKIWCCGACAATLLGVVCASGRSPDDAFTLCLESMEDTISGTMGEISKSGDHSEMMKGMEEATNYIKKEASDIFGILRSSNNPF
jgi:hypothetical protein